MVGLTNFDPTITAPEIYEEAARNTNFKVFVVKRPLPRDDFDPDFDNYYPENYPHLYSLHSKEIPSRDHSPFWNEVDRLRALSK